MSARVLLFLALGPLIQAETTDSPVEPIRQLAFGSCLKETRPAPAMEAVAALKPDVFVWMGDNIYGNSEDMAVLREKYARVDAMPAYQAIASSAEVIGTWDDHDYGKDNVGKEFPAKVGSQKELLTFLRVPKDSPRWSRKGVYGLYDFGPTGKQVRVMLLDTRYHRDETGSDGDMLGDEQWAWLEQALTESQAQVNVIVSSIQFLASDHRFEKWADFQKEKQRMLDLLARKDVPPVLFLSGDRHLSEISLDSKSLGYPLYDITSSSLNLPLGGTSDEPNGLRVGRNFRPANFGTLSFDWSRDIPVVTASIRDKEGVPQRGVSIELSRQN